MTVEILRQADAETVSALSNLIPQLSSSTGEFSEADVTRLLSQPGVFVFAYRTQSGGPILGTLTLATFEIPTGVRGWVEDVVVDEQARGHGAGQQLVEAALAKATEIGCRTVDLTTRPVREAANRLYVRCGFEPRETNIYRYTPAQ